MKKRQYFEIGKEIIGYYQLTGEASLGYKATSDGIVVTCYEGSLPAELAIPETIEGLTVVEIGAGAFEDAEALESVVIPETVRAIGAYAFEGCSNLAAIALPKGLTKLGGWAFRDCVRLESVVVPAGVASIGNWTFAGCVRLAAVMLPGAVEKIGVGAFFGCESLETFTAPKPAAEIEASAFRGCAKLRTIYLDESVKRIGLHAFADCGSLPLAPARPVLPTSAANRYRLVNGAALGYQPVEAGLVVSDYIGALPADVVLPESVDGVPVVGIDRRAFDEIPSSVSVVFSPSPAEVRVRDVVTAPGALALAGV